MAAGKGKTFKGFGNKKSGNSLVRAVRNLGAPSKKQTSKTHDVTKKGRGQRSSK